MGIVEVSNSLRGPDVSCEALKAFWQLRERTREALDQALERFAVEIPVFAQLVADTTPEARRADAQRSRRLEHDAIVRGCWRELGEDLVRQGEMYATIGISLADWQRIIGAFRGFMRREIERAHPTDPDARLEIATGMDAYLDWSMGTLGASYVAERQKQVDRATGQLDVHRALFEHASIGMQIFAHSTPDADSWALLSANAVAVALTGLDPRTAPAVVPRHDNGDSQQMELLERLRGVADGGGPAEWEATDSDARGMPRTLAMRAFSLTADHIGVVLEDVSTRRRLEVARRRALDSLARSNRELDHFAYVASHDLRAPLRDVDNLASWIEEDVGDGLPSESRRHFAQLRSRILRMEKLLDDLLQYSRVGRHHQSAERFDARTVVRAAVDQVGVGDEFRVELQGDALELWTPRVPLEQVLRNLIDNAIKHHARIDGSLTIVHRSAGSMVRFSLRDDGPGIPPEYHDRIFGMFQTLKPRDETEGSGMGLALVKKIVERHGGSIEVRSQPGDGSEFSFTWPQRWHESEEVRES